ncbi:MAG TPA: 3-hydroxyisobutyrate dehydrogenase [Alphaproteobacteria bacterium]|nr:3-hydroxyisobutyrate dehydrogenase [Alphaproteobacteria bacterium]
MTQHIAFIGLGNMGGPMALNLCKAGYNLSVFDVMPDAVKKLTDAGATAAADIPTAVKNADIVITMLPGNEHVKKVYLDASGVLAHAKAGALLIDSSTINADIARDVAKSATQKGFRMIDAPVSGGTAGAAAGTLTFIVGGAAADLESARPALEKMGKNIFHAGASGAGQLAKICNNMLLAVLMIGTSEALNLGVSGGLDPKVLSEIMSKSSGRNWTLEVYNPMPGVMENVPASRGYTGGFGTDLMLKDLGLAMEIAASAAAATPLGAHARELYKAHSEAGSGKLDFSSILQFVEKQKLAKSA